MLPPPLRTHPCGVGGLARACCWGLYWPQPPTPALRTVLFYCSHTGFLLVRRMFCILFSRPQGLCPCISVYPQCLFLTSCTSCFCLCSFASHLRHHPLEVFSAPPRLGQSLLVSFPFLVRDYLSSNHIFICIMVSLVTPYSNVH